MCNENQRPCSLKAIFWVAVVISAIVAAVSLISTMEARRIEREQDERDGDIKECGC